MSETEAAAVVPAGPSAGTLLREAREAAGLHVSTLAANLKVPVRKLEALEEDRYDELPDAVFVRALASSVCRTLKVDAAPVLERLPQMRQPRLSHGEERINAPFHAPSDGPPPGVLHQVSRPVVLTVVALLLGALVLILLPFAQRTIPEIASEIRKVETPKQPPTDTPRPEQPTTTPATAAGPVNSGLPGAPASAAGVVPTPAAVTQAPEAGASAPGVQLRTSASTAVAPAAAPAPLHPASAAPAAAVAAATPATAPSSAPIDAKGVVVFRARGQSWVQVKDARGTTVMQKLLEAGETAGASGQLPLTVTVGSAQVTDVQVRGKPFDLAHVARDNVARFEVK